MDFLSKIETVQQKPVQTRRRILVITVALIMTMVIGAWFAVLSRTLNLSAANNQEASSQKTAMTPFSLLGDQFKDAFQNLKNFFK